MESNNNGFRPEALITVAIVAIAGMSFGAIGMVSVLGIGMLILIFT